MPSAYIVNGLALPIITDPKRQCLEANRLESFDATWPHKDDSLCSPSNMAKAGFFYNGISDQVRCFCCLTKMDGWESDTDEPWTKHKQLSPICQFAIIGKEENELTIEQWCDVLCNRAINQIDHKFNKIMEFEV